MAGIVERVPAGEHVPFGDAGESCDVSLSTVDMLSVGMSLRMQARNQKTPHGTREIYARVGQQMVSAAHRKMMEQAAAKVPPKAGGPAGALVAICERVFGVSPTNPIGQPAPTAVLSSRDVAMSELESVAKMLRAAPEQAQRAAEADVARSKAAHPSIAHVYTPYPEMAGALQSACFHAAGEIDRVLETLKPRRTKATTRPPVERDETEAGAVPRSGPPCKNYSPPWFTGRWKDWHRGHGCDRDDGRPRAAEAQAEIDRAAVPKCTGRR